MPPANEIANFLPSIFGDYRTNMAAGLKGIAAVFGYGFAATLSHLTGISVAGSSCTLIDKIKEHHLLKNSSQGHTKEV